MKQRDWVVDIVRLLAVLIVVSMHWTYGRVTMVAGKVVITTSYSGMGWRIATWLLMVMPAFFIAGGFANTLIWDRCVRTGESYGAYLGLRARRLITPVIPLLTLILVLVIVLNQFSPGLARMLGDQAANVLWFLACYLLCVAVAPLQVWLHDRIGSAIPFAGLVTAALGMKYLETRGHVGIDLSYLLLLIWPACHQLGVVYQRRRWHTLPTWALALIALASAGVVAWLVQLPGYGHNAIGLRNDSGQNLIPSTAAMAFLALAQLAALVWLSRKAEDWAPSPVWQRRIGAATALMMPIYLWHLPTLLVLTGIGMAFPALLVEPWWLWWLTRPLFFALGIALLGGIVALVARWELLAQTWQARTATVPVVVGTALAGWGIFELWRYTIDLEPLGLAAAAAVFMSLPLVTTFRKVEH